MVEILKVREDYGALFARDLDGEPLDLAQVEDVVERLTALRDAMRSTGLDQYELAQRAKRIYVDKLSTRYTLHYPANQPYLQYVPGGSRPTKAPKYSGVYFMSFVGWPLSVKIGLSIDIHQRMKGLWSEHQHFTPIVHGWIETDERRVVERSLHEQFAKYHIQSEWFDTEPVMEWLGAHS